MIHRITQKLPIGYLLVILATAGWGTSGLFITFVLAKSGISALALAFWRDVSTFTCLLIAVGLIKPALLKVQRRDLLWLAGLGICSIGAFHVFWNMSVWTNGVSVATVLQEAAPAFVTIIAWLVWREPITRLKVLAIVITFAGCVLVARLDNLAQAELTATGILIGVLSAITYGSYSLFGKQVTGRYTPWTVLTYGFGFGALVLFPLQFLSPGPWPILTPARWWFVGLIILPTIISFAIYTVGLRWLSASVAAIVATSEVVFASVFAYVFLHERLDWLQIVGAVLVVGGVIMLSLSKAPAVAPRPASAETEFTLIKEATHVCEK